MNIGTRIKKRRKELGLSADKLAIMIGKDRSTVFRYERGDIENLPLDILEPIAKALSTTPAYLMGWEHEQKKNDALADIVLRLRTDDELFDVVNAICNLDREKLSSLAIFLK